MTQPAAPAVTTGPSARRPHWIGLVGAVVLLIVSNIMSNRILPWFWFVPWNLAVAAALMVIAQICGSGPAAVGFHIRHWRRPVVVGLLLAATIGVIYGIGMAIPATRDAFMDSRAADLSLGALLYQVLVRIPLGTALPEEIAFRGVLPALMGGAPAVGWRWGPVLGASALFGLWHILPSLGITSDNAAVHQVLGSHQVVATILTVVAMTAVGVLLCALARVGRGIKTTMLLHWASNALGLFAAWLIFH